MNILRDPVLLLLAFALLGWVVYETEQPPKALPASVHDTAFSALRAHSLLREMYPDNQPHESGSARNRALRKRIVSILRRFGYQPEIQSRFHCRADIGRCSPVEDIVAVRKGTKSGGAVLLTAHYDSVPAGPGVGDDGSGVAAVLEIARMAHLQEELTHDLVILLTDAEEQGLLGADAFARHHPLFDSVRAVINLEARGVSGPSMMFETGDENRDLVTLFADSVDQPVANSITYEVYRHMPNDTDFSVYRARGLTGVNFAFTHGAALYHSRIDDLGHLDLDSLQHHGQNGWAMLQALNQFDLNKLVSSEDAAYIDLFGKYLMHYPLSIAAGLALALGALVLIAIRWSFPRQVVFRQVLWTSLAILLLLCSVPAVGWLLSWPLGRWVDVNPVEHPYPWLGRLTLLMSVLWTLIRVLRFVARRASTGSVMATCWGFYVTLALVLAIVFPVASYLGLFPIAAFCAGLILDSLRWRRIPRLSFAGLFGFLAAAYLGVYYFFQLDVVLNFSHSEVKVAPLLLPAVAILPLLVWHFEPQAGKNRFSLMLLVLIMAGCVGQQFIPGYTAEAPRNMNLMVWQAESRPEAWLVLESATGAPDRDFARNHGFVPAKLPPFDGKQRQVLARTIEPVELPKMVEAGQVTQASDLPVSSNRHQLELKIPAGARLLVFEFPRHAAMTRATIDGLLAFDAGQKPPKVAADGRLVINHPSPGAHRFEFDLSGSAATDVRLTAHFNLPPAVWQPYKEDWPVDAQPAYLGSRVLQVSDIRLGGDGAK